MVLEIAQIDVAPGKEAEFEAGFAKAKPLFDRAKGCKSASIHRSVSDLAHFPCSSFSANRLLRHAAFPASLRDVPLVSRPPFVLKSCKRLMPVEGARPSVLLRDWNTHHTSPARRRTSFTPSRTPFTPPTQTLHRRPTHSPRVSEATRCLSALMPPHITSCSLPRPLLLTSSHLFPTLLILPRKSRRTVF